MTVRSDIEAYTIASGVKTANFPVGAAKTLRINVTDSAGAAQTMTGWSLQFVLRQGDLDAGGQNGAAKVTKATGGSGITIGNGSGTDDRASVALTYADTSNLPPGIYNGALWRTDSTNDDPLWVGNIVLTPAGKQA